MFAVLKAAKELKTKDRAEFMFDLIGVICSPNMKQENLESYAKGWLDKANDAIPEFKEERVNYVAGRPVMPMKQASELMLQQLKVMKRVNYGQ